jgi:signal transduction histidine kinase
MRYSQVTPLILLLATVLSLMAVFFGVRNIIRPLQALSEQAGRVAWGDFAAVEKPEGGVQEIKDLHRTLTQMADQIRRYQAGMRDYIAAITRGQEEERKRLARELHDDTTQSLIALNQRLEMVHKALTRNPNRVPALLDELREMAGATLQGVRRYSRNLRPLYLEDLGFLPALEMRLREFDATGEVLARLQVSGKPHRLPADLEMAAYRITQEALNNVAQHAQASQVTLTVDFSDEGLTLTVEDDGIGFVVPEQPADLTSNGHFGLMGMRERALLYGGHLEIRPASGQGTKLIVYLPA